MNATAAGVDWSRGYYCAVAILLREAGCVTPEVRALFDQGGGAERADAADIDLFREHGLLPALPATATSHAQSWVDAPDERLESFHAGQVWQSPRGTLYRVVAVERGRHAVLRAGLDGKGRQMVRGWSAVLGGWVLHSDPMFPAAGAQGGRHD
jgi:hypothetical protein